MSDQDNSDMAPPRPRAARWLLLLPVLAVIWVPLYNRIEPSVFGIPFFYWYQLLWVALSAAVIGIVYRAETR